MAVRNDWPEQKRRQLVFNRGFTSIQGDWHSEIW